MNARTPNLMMPSETTPEEAPKSLGEIIDLAQNHADQGEIGSAIALYARWLEHPQAVGRPVADRGPAGDAASPGT